MAEEGAPAPPPDPLAKLRGIVDAFPGQGFAVVDGGHFPDLPAEFRRERLFARSLFLGSADPEVQAAGPWLVKLGQAPDATDKVFALVGEKPAAVFWCCDAGEMVLWRHLRGLNMARIPKWAADGLPKSDEVEDFSLFTSVIFRHCDPRVLGALLPVLDPQQFRRIVGPAHEFAFNTHEYGGLRRVLLDLSWPSPKSGMLHITSEQIQALNDRRSLVSRRRICRFLRIAAPQETYELSDEQLLELATQSETSGSELGLVSEQAQGKWAFLIIKTQGRILRDAKTRALFEKNEISADQKMTFLLQNFELRSDDK